MSFFLKWLIIGYFRLGLVILSQVNAPKGKAIGPAGTRNRRKATVKHTKGTLLILSMYSYSTIRQLESYHCATYGHN